MIFIVLKGFFGSSKPKETLYLSCFMGSALFCNPCFFRSPRGFLFLEEKKQKNFLLF